VTLNRCVRRAYGHRNVGAPHSAEVSQADLGELEQELHPVPAAAGERAPGSWALEPWLRWLYKTDPSWSGAPQVMPELFGM